MDTLTLLKDLRTIRTNRDNVTPRRKQKNTFVNVYAADRLPKNNLNFDANNFFLISNDSPSTSSGRHWLAFYLTRKNNKNIIEFFDSYGLSPYTNKYFTRFLKHFGDKIIYNKKMLQSPFSTKCGKYCICFLHHRSIDKTMTSFLNLFSDDYTENDKKIEKMYKKITKRSSHNQTGGSCKINRKCIQSCLSLLKSQ